jgi:hypothetical protein
MTLVETLEDPVKAAAVTVDGAAMIERQVGSKRGIRGMALKAGYKVVRKIRPGIIEEVLGSLLPRFAPAIDPHHAAARASGNVHRHFMDNAEAIAESLLAVTDARAKVATNRIMVKAYTSLRSHAKGHVIAAMPDLARLITDHVH